MSKKILNDLAVLLNEIQAITNLSLDEIAERIGKTRPYLSSRKAIDKNDETNQRLIEALRVKCAKELKVRILDSDRISAHDAMISVLVAEVASLRSERTGEPIQSIIKKLYKAGEDAIENGLAYQVVWGCFWTYYNVF